MNHCVPDWGVNEFSDDFPSPAVKQQACRPSGSNRGFVPADDFQELCWEHGKLVVVTHDQFKPQRHHEFRPCKPESRLIKCMPKQSVGAVFLAGQPAPKSDETLEAVVGGAGGTPMCLPPDVCDDEMLQWLHYPLNGSIESNSSELQSGYPNAAALLNKNSGDQTPTGVHLTSLRTLTKSKDHRNDNSQQNRLALPHNLDTIEDVMPGSTWTGHSKRESNHPPTESLTSVTRSNVGSISSVTSASISNSSAGVNQDFAVTSNISFSKMLPTFPYSDSVYSHPLNFPHFSGPSAAEKANLNHVGTTTGLSALEKVKPSKRVEAKSCGDLLIESCGMGRGLYRSTKGEGEFLSTSMTHSNVGSWKAADPGVCGNKSLCTEHVSVDRGLYNGSHQLGEELPTCWSDGSGNGAANSSRVACVQSKRKAGELEGSECQSQDRINAEQKPPILQSDLRSRSRAAEVHNLSEKRRRERINEKLKALQELVPNSNKTDKASMLEEAIEYMKMLQAQIQVMSNMYGMGFSSPPMPAHGMQHVHVLPQQMGVVLENTSGLTNADVGATCMGVPHPGWGMPMANVQYLPNFKPALQPLLQSPPIIYGNTQFSHDPSTALSSPKEVHVQNPSSATGNSMEQQVHQPAQPVICGHKQCFGKG